MDDFTPPGDGLGPLVDQGDNRTRNGLVQKALSDFQNLTAGKRVHVIGFEGQSMRGNWAISGQSGSGTYQIQYPGKVFMFDYWNGALYNAADPVLGANWYAGRGSPIFWLADLVIANGLADYVVSCNWTVGGVPAQYWASGGVLVPRRAIAVQRLKNAGLNLTLIESNEGQEDAGVYGTDAATFASYRRQAAQWFLDNGINCPFLSSVGVCWPGTVVSGSGPWTSVRTGQLRVTDPTLAPSAPVPGNIIVGPDEDTLAPYPYRIGGVQGNPNIGEPHYNQNGCSAWAQMALQYVPRL